MLCTPYLLTCLNINVALDFPLQFKLDTKVVSALCRLIREAHQKGANIVLIQV